MMVLVDSADIVHLYIEIEVIMDRDSKKANLLFSEPNANVAGYLVNKNPRHKDH